MSRCDFAEWKPIGRSPGPFKGGPLKIVHHTTEGDSAAGAFAAYRAKGVTPHFTVDSKTIYQHHDTSRSSSAVLNLAGGVETNRLGAIQIEVVARAGRRKNEETLRNVARLCRWLEAEHDIPPVWPSGPPRYGTSDPGGHNRSVANWVSQSGHYGHSQVPENTHWDPSYFPEELDLVMEGVAPQHVFKLFIDGKQVTEAAGATLENGQTLLNCVAKELCAAMGWAIEYRPEVNWTVISTRENGQKD